MAKEAKEKSGKKAQLKNQVGKSARFASRITVVGPGSETARISKEDATQSFAEAVLNACELARAEVRAVKKCIVVKFSNLPSDAVVTAFVFGGDHIVVSAESNDPTVLYNSMRRTFATVEYASKFVRCAFIKDNVELALKVPCKPPKVYGSGGSRTSSNHNGNDDIAED